jgi:phosphate uptake regulator
MTTENRIPQLKAEHEALSALYREKFTEYRNHQLNLEAVQQMLKTSGKAVADLRTDLNLKTKELQDEVDRVTKSRQIASPQLIT